MKKSVLISVLLGVFTLVLLSACGVKESGNVFTEGVDTEYETMMAAEIIGVLDWIRATSALDFEASMPSSFDRNEETAMGMETLSIDGHGMIVTGVPFEDNDIDNLFVDAGWEMSISNMADGMVASLAGYYKDGIGCLIYQELENFDEEAEFEDNFDENSTSSIEINCGPIVVG